jgi:hypothetical protein
MEEDEEGKRKRSVNGREMEKNIKKDVKGKNMEKN